MARIRLSCQTGPPSPTSPQERPRSSSVGSRACPAPARRVRRAAEGGGSRGPPGVGARRRPSGAPPAVPPLPPPRPPPPSAGGAGPGEEGGTCARRPTCAGAAVGSSGRGPTSPCSTTPPTDYSGSSRDHPSDGDGSLRVSAVEVGVSGASTRGPTPKTHGSPLFGVLQSVYLFWNEVSSYP